MKDILVFNPVALENGRGGEFFSIELATGLNNFYEVTLIDTNRFIGKPLFSKKEIKKKLKGIESKNQIKYAKFHIFNLEFNFPYPWEIVRLYKLVKNHKIIYIAISNFKTDLIFMLFSKLHRQGKFVIGYHKPLYTEKKFSLYNLKYRLTILFFSIFKKRIYHHTISRHTKKFLERFYEKDKVIFLIEGLELRNFLSSKRDEKKRTDLLNFIYVGSLDDEHKGVGILLKGIEKFLEENKNFKVHFDFCAFGPLEPDLTKLIEKYPQKIVIYGFLSREKLIECYSNNDVILFSSRREPFGRVIIEALATEKIIICSKTIGSVEILRRKDFAFFLKELTPDEINNKMIEVYNLWKKNPNKINNLKKSAKNYIAQTYSIDKEIDMFRKFFSEIIVSNK